jgi:recombination associated protein RdgC
MRYYARCVRSTRVLTGAPDQGCNIMFWFKNLMIYRVTRELAITAQDLETSLPGSVFSPCGSQDMAKFGWVSPMGHNSEALTHEVNGQILLCARKEEKILPSSVVKNELQGKIEKLEADQSRKLRKTEKDQLKDEVLFTLMPRAFSRYSSTFLWLDTVRGLVIVDAASAKKAEDALALLRKSLGSLPVVPLTLENPIELTLTKWVRSGESPSGLVIQDEAELKAVLEDDEIAAHIEAGKVVTQLALDWQERIQFILAADGTLKRLKYSDTLQEQNDDIDREDVAARFDADFILMTGELSELIRQLTEALGGETQA